MKQTTTPAVVPFAKRIEVIAPIGGRPRPPFGLTDGRQVTNEVSSAQ